MFIYEDAICFVDPLSFEDVTVVVDFHWFADCHLETIFNMNTSRLQPRSPITVDGKNVRLITGVFLSTRLSAILFRTAGPKIVFSDTKCAVVFAGVCYLK